MFFLEVCELFSVCLLILELILPFCFLFLKLLLLRCWISCALLFSLIFLLCHYALLSGRLHLYSATLSKCSVFFSMVLISNCFFSFPEYSFYIADFCALSSLFNSDGINSRIYFKVFFSLRSLCFRLFLITLSFTVGWSVELCRGIPNVSILKSLLLGWSNSLFDPFITSSGLLFCL